MLGPVHTGDKAQFDFAASVYRPLEGGTKILCFARLMGYICVDFSEF